MWKSMLLVLGVLVCPLAPTAKGCGDSPTAGTVKPAGPKKGAFIQKTVVVEIQGKLVFVRCLMFGRTSVGIQAKGQTYWLDLHGDKELHRQLKELGEGTVLVKGELEEVVDPAKEKETRAHLKGMDYLVNVTSLSPGEGESVKQTVKVVIQGPLREDLREILRPYGVTWYVKVDGKDYYLNFRGNKAWAAQAASWADRMVRLTGTLERNGRWNIVHVSALAVAQGEEVSPR